MFLDSAAKIIKIIENLASTSRFFENLQNLDIQSRKLGSKYRSSTKSLLFAPTY